MRMLFPAHGKTRLEIDGQIIRLYVYGPWNKELVIETHKNLLSALHALDGSSWALMVITVESAICGPDAIEQIRLAAASEVNKSGRVATAWVIDSTIEGGRIMNSVVNNLYKGINPVNIFEDEKFAKAWLLQELLKITAC
jgi:hypothetical protein